MDQLLVLITKLLDSDVLVTGFSRCFTILLQNQILNTFTDKLFNRFLFKLLELIEGAEAEFAELGGVLLLLGELLGVPVEDDV